MNQRGSFWRNRYLRIFLGSVLVIGVGAGIIWGFLEGAGERASEALREAPVKAPQRISVVNGETVITLDAATQRLSGIETASLQTTQSNQQLRAYGTVLDLQSLTELNNGYANASAQLQIARAKLAASKTAFERARNLYNDQQNMSLAQFQAAEAAYQTDQASVAAAESLLATLAATAKQAWGSVLGRAVVERTPLLTQLIGQQNVLIQVSLPPGQSLAKAPQTAFVQTDNGPRANIQFVSPATKTDPRIQGASFFYTAAATGNLVPGMNVVASLPSDATREGVIVPGSAVVWWQGRAWIYLRTAPETFARRDIATDSPTADGGYVATNIPNLTDVVTQGAQTLLSEEFRAQVQVGEEGPQ